MRAAVITQGVQPLAMQEISGIGRERGLPRRQSHGGYQ
jgi:hypothetical protein